ncbi:MAG: DUF4870 domain-containing protein [Cyanobacteriota bacterium]|nr:DUF4870 domain-containing protein [Cyanobacteriota bacterium]
MYDPDRRKILNVLCHGSILLSTTVVSIGLPIAILLASADPVVKKNAKEALNVHLNFWICYLVLYVWIVVFFTPDTTLLILILLLMSWILPIIAIVRVLANPESIYRYPFISRFV